MSQQFGVGSILGTAFRVYLRNFIPFTLIAGLLYIPMIVFTGWFLNSEFTVSSLLKYAGISAVLSLVLNSFVSATLTYGVVKELQGQRASIGACIATGFTRMLPALGV